MNRKQLLKYINDIEKEVDLLEVKLGPKGQRAFDGMAKSCRTYLNGGVDPLESGNTGSSEGIIDTVKKSCQKAIVTIGDNVVDFAKSAFDFCKSGLSVFEFNVAPEGVMLQESPLTPFISFIAKIINKILNSTNSVNTNTWEYLFYTGAACYMLSFLYIAYDPDKLNRAYNEFKKSMSELFSTIGKRFTSGKATDLVSGVLSVFMLPLTINSKLIDAVRKSGKDYIIPLSCMIIGMALFCLSALYFVLRPLETTEQTKGKKSVKRLMADVPSAKDINDSDSSSEENNNIDARQLNKQKELTDKLNSFLSSHKGKLVNGKPNVKIEYAKKGDVNTITVDGINLSNQELSSLKSIISYYVKLLNIKRITATFNEQKQKFNMKYSKWE